MIQVGGSSEEEIKELRDRLDDAQYAVKAALEEGYLPGAGNVLLCLSKDVEKEVKSDNADEQLGIQIFANALRAPFKKILENAGVSYENIMQQILEKGDLNYGYNARTLQLVDLLGDGIIDPAKVLTGTVYAAASIASVILTSSCIITEDPIENKGLSLNMMPAAPMM